MALYRLACVKCRKKASLLTDKPLAEAIVELKCVDCGEKLERAGTGPSTSVVERLDNGLMARAVERPRDAEEWQMERSMNADPLAGRK